jgi:hypothetical protein
LTFTRKAGEEMRSRVDELLHTLPFVRLRPPPEPAAREREPAPPSLGRLVGRRQHVLRTPLEEGLRRGEGHGGHAPHDGRVDCLLGAQRWR